MPCWTIQTNQIDFQKVDFQTFVDSLKAAGHTVIFQDAERQEVQFRMKDSYDRITFKNGNLSGAASERELQTSALALKQSYSRQVVQAQAKRFGWLTREIAPNKFEIVRRY
jgi:deoxyribodipyrimidine photolyase-like uncharacterized protein